MSKNDLLSRGSISDVKSPGERHIVCLSGGVSSAWVAMWANKNITGEILYYFNDTKWEHPDLYRFLDDLARVLKIAITYDSDGRNPEQVFFDQHMLGNNRAPLCSRILKAERLQKFVNRGDTLYFGIDTTEIHRAARITPIYARHGCPCIFPLIDNSVTKPDLLKWLTSTGIELPQMYKDGFSHNNCSGGCVRAGKKQWVSLLSIYPKVYAAREQVEIDFNTHFGTAATFIKGISLTELREAVESQMILDFDAEPLQGECVGICGRMY